MNLVLLVSVVISFAALVWSLILLWRLRDWRMAFLTLLLTTMILRQTISLVEGAMRAGNWQPTMGGNLTGFPETMISMMALLAVLYLELMITEHKKIGDALRQSEALFHSLVENLPQYIIRKDLDGRIIFANGRYCELLGRPLDEIVGEDDFDHYPHGQAEKYRADDLLVMETGEILDTVEENTLRDGHTLQVRVVKTPVLDVKNRIVGVQGIFWDITESERARRALRDSEALYHSLVENLPQNVFRKDLNHRVTFGNQRYCETLGKPLDQLLGKDDYDVYPPELAAKYQADDRRVVETGKSIETVEENRSVDGTKIFVQVVKTPVYDSRGEIVGVQGIFWDISERKQALEALSESEEKYRSFVERANDGICIIQDTIVKYANEQLAIMGGYELKDFINKCYADYLQEDEFTKVAINYELHMSGQEPVQRYETALVHRDGHRLDIEINAGLINYEGNPASLVFIRDITERKKAETKLRESEERFRQLAEHINEVFWLTDWNTRDVLYVSPAYESIRGRTCKSLYENPQSWTYDLHPEDRERVLTSFQRNSERGNYNEQFRVIRPNGDVRWLQERAFPIRDENGIVYRMAGVSEDITERRDTEEQLRQRDTALAHVTRLSTMGEMVAGIAHEINQPLYAISNYATACRTVVDSNGIDRPEKLMEWTDQISAEATRAAEIIRRLANFIQKAPMQRKVMDPNQLVSQSVELVRPELSRNNVVLQLELPDELPEVEVDPVQIQQVMVNLLQNASEAMLKAGVPDRQIAVGTSLTDNHVVISVKDKGPGVPANNSNTVFEAFFSTKEDGMGMGLAVSRTIVESHGGEIWSTRNEDDGATFRFSIPINEGGDS